MMLKRLADVTLLEGGTFSSSSSVRSSRHPEAPSPISSSCSLLRAASNSWPFYDISNVCLKSAFIPVEFDAPSPLSPP